ncbi:MAG TPA: hypothetical protein DCX54_01855 [Flavobacteriales bacterium]|nr:hypothetical protein [Flavobacteriales bacterium]
MTKYPSQNKVSRVALDIFRLQKPTLSPKESLKTGQPALVKRLDRLSNYFLVPIYDNIGLCGIIQLEAQNLSLETLSVIQNSSSMFLATEDSVLGAVQTTFPKLYGWRKPFLAWQPCRESFDSTRPLWVVPHSNGQVYVTQDCQVFETLTAGRGGTPRPAEY